MRFKVHHFTRYAYTLPVTLGEHTLRLLPQLPADAVEYHRITIEPIPVVERSLIDAMGNRVLAVQFVGQTQVLSIDSNFAVVVPVPPLAVDPGWPSLPWVTYSDAIPFGATWNDGSFVDPSVMAFARELASAAAERPLDFLQLLTSTLFSRMDRQIRWEGDAQTAAETLSTLRGACRDITVLYLDCCRALGISGRFVSGYQSAAETPDGQRHLHAWPEVYLPTLGWRGFDATHGIPVTDGHLALSRGATQAQTMPVEGGFYFSGTELSSTLDYGVRIETN